MDLKWRFPDNGNGKEVGLETGDIDIFKKDPIGSLAREICQNSIDANCKSGCPTRIEFKTFTVKRDDIPGINELTEQIDKCYEYRKDDNKEGAAITAIHAAIHSNEIDCLRISDYNTTGLTGVSKFERGKPFYNLTKTSGTSFKKAGSGGSKGIGKAAAFVASSTRTVFYSTYTIEEEKWYIGTAKLRSVPIDADGYKMTVDEGYYGVSEHSFPKCDEELILDPNFIRKEGDYGTDLYLIGFGHRENWKSDLIYKLLDSFMVAFAKGELEVVLDDIELTESTLKRIVNDRAFFSNKTEANLYSLKAQYELLTEGENIIVSKRDIKGYGCITVYVQSYSQGESYRATGTCEIIRYPYMRITSYGGGRLIPYSALCIIGNNKLNEALRRMENAEHTAWAPERLETDMERKDGASIIRSLRNQISRAINEALRKEVGDKSDIAGAGAFLPSVDSDELLEGNEFRAAVNDQIQIGKIRSNISARDKAESENSKGDKMNRDINTHIGDETDNQEAQTSDPTGSSGSSGIHGTVGKSVDGGNPMSTKDASVNSNGNKKGQVRKLLGGMRKRNMYDKKNNCFIITFVSTYNEENCEIEVKEIGESTDSYDVNIESAMINGVPCTVEGGVIKSISLVSGKKYTVTYYVSDARKFATGVDIYANR